MHDAHHAPASSTDPKIALIGIALVLAVYAGAAVFQWPQHGRDLLVSAQASHGHEDGHADAHGAGAAPPPLAVVPFVLLLGAIAVLPLTPPLQHWWERNSSKLLVAGLLGLVTLGYYTFIHRHAVELHFPAHAVVAAAESGPAWGVAGAVLANALLAEYVPFIVLLLALYVITGGVRIEGDLEATPTVNTAFIAAATTAWAGKWSSTAWRWMKV